MGIFRQFPYTNFHDMNLDWLLARLREYMDMTHVLEQNIIDFEGRVTIDIDEFKADVNSRMADFIQYVENYLEGLAIPEAVQEILDQWLADGVFDEILNRLVEDAMHVVDEKLAEFETEQAMKLTSNDIDVEPKLTFVYKDNRTDSPSNPQYPIFQAIAVAEDGNIITVGNDESETTNNAKIRVFSSSGTLLRESVVPTGHSNGMTYRQGKIYVAHMREEPSRESSDRVSIIDYNTLSVDRVVRVGDYFRAIAWDSDTDTFILAGGGSGSTYEFYVYNNDFSQRLNTFYLPTNYSKYQGLQDIFYYNKCVGVIVSYPNLIAFYDIETQELVKYYSPKQRTGRYSAPYNEIESIAVHNQVFYTTAFSRLDNNKSMNIIATIDPWKNTIMDYTKRNRTTGTLTLYVDGSYNGVIQNGEYSTANPAINTPFNNIMQAINAVQSEIHTTTPITIYCKRGTDVGALVCHDIPNLAVVAYGSGTENYNLDGMRINRCANFHIENAHIGHRSDQSTGTANAYIINSSGALISCSINGNDISDGDTPIGLYVGGQSNITVFNYTCPSTLAEGIRINDQSIVSLTGSTSNTAPIRVRTLNQGILNSTIKMKPADTRYKFESLALVSKPWVHVKTGVSNAINTDIPLTNDANITNINQGVSEICIEISFGGELKKHCIALTTDNGTSQFSVGMFHKFVALWYGEVRGTIDLTNKIARITEQYSVNYGTGVGYVRSDGTAPSGTAWAGIANIWVH